MTDPKDTPLDQLLAVASTHAGRLVGTTPNKRERDLAYTRSHYAWSPDEAARFYADYREELLREFEALAATFEAAAESAYPPRGEYGNGMNAAYAGDASDVRRLIAKLRGGSDGK